MMNSSILVIEDEAKVANSIKRGLEDNYYMVEIAFDGAIGKTMAVSNAYNAIILDINLPKINGFDLCKEIRAINSKIPILMLTALGSLQNKETGFNAGADDYLVKPFEFKELLLRLRALLKRSAEAASGTTHVLKIADLEVNMDTKLVTRGGETINLTAKEFQLLEYFLKNKGRIISKVDLAEKLWNHTFDTGTNVIEVYVNFLRKKIDKNHSPKLIHTHIGMGYIMKEGE
ncbi:response regulator transcription factor [Rhodocytophaga rosea]|uniref:Response regulator transcription factor n=1 Tax=Rhodocytophaga rosea TaxID=2704465 RepID=A0A6C0GL98_9BACT|nr:response regulator transcription factor [Rhodocytophaga rosea]QHT68759.1 response regulator transcription factor [Rhodocytophaga rosea]